MFFYLAIVSCLIFFFFDIYWCFHILRVKIPVKIILILTGFPVILSLFLLFSYRNCLLSSQQSDVDDIDILPFLGTLFAIWGIRTITCFILLNKNFHISTHYLHIIVPAIQFIVGIGVLYRDRFFGLFGSFFLTAATIYTSYSLNNSFTYIIYKSIFPITLSILLLILREHSFKRNAFADFFDGEYSGSTYSSGSTSVSKSCTHCGKEVSSSATAGQSCPHCGVYWSTERTTHKN